MSLEHQRIFLNHMGHEAVISRDNYQCPIGIKEVRVMGKLLDNIDKVTWSREETDELRKVFKDFFTVSTSNTNCNNGCLPNKGEIIDFLKNHMPQCLKSLNMQSAYI